MKQILHTTVVLASMFLSLNVNAKTKLSINTTMPTTMKVVIDGRKFYSQDNNINIRNLQPGYHNISIYYIKNGNDFNSFYNNGNSGYWKKAISRNVVVKNNYQYDITINRFGKAFFDQDYYSNNYYYRGDGGNVEENEDDNDAVSYDFESNNGYDENYSDLDYFKKQGINVQNHNVPTPSNYYNNYNNNGNKVMSNQIFNQVKQTIQQQSFESSKLDFAKQSLDKNYITTNQAKEIANLFKMESNKLDFSKYAYDRVMDKENYFTMANNFTMQSNKDDLLKYIRNRK
ncbi:MAG: DUF4476 domain-containing protein [Chitinophagaceae bacterium]